VEQPRVGGAVGQLAGLHAVVGKLRLGLGQRQVEVVEQPLPAAAHRGHVVEGVLARSPISSSREMVASPVSSGSSPCRNSARASHRASLFWVDSSMLMRSMPSQ
jgi:hypothetical protein